MMIAYGSLILVLLFGMGGCSTEARDETGESRSPADTGHAAGPARLMLVESHAFDSAALATPIIVDQAFRRAFDSIPGAEWVTMNYIDSVSAEGQEGVSIEALGRELELDGVVVTQIARFGSVIAVDASVIEPSSGATLFKDRAFSFIRYRDAEGSPLMGPALYEAVERLVYRLHGMPDAGEHSVSSIPIAISSVAIADDSRLKGLSQERGRLATLGVRALGDYARLNYPELVVFDYASRQRVLDMIGVRMVEDYAEPTRDERQAYFSLDLGHYLTARIAPVGRDSAYVGSEIRYVVSPGVDSVVTAHSDTVSIAQLTAPPLDESYLQTLLDVTQPALREFAIAVRGRYDQKRTTAPFRPGE